MRIIKRVNMYSIMIWALFEVSLFLISTGAALFVALSVVKLVVLMLVLCTDLWSQVNPLVYKCGSCLIQTRDINKSIIHITFNIIFEQRART